MKQKEDTSTPDSANISDMQTNEEDDERAESRERSRGKRRTAREIASMFEQLKQRHIARKKEWHEEREDLMKRVQTADESKRVLTELKGILENLREELRLEERKRIDMESDHFTEKRQWETDKMELLKRLEESAHESDRDGQDFKRLTEKLAEQSRQMAEWQSSVLELKKQLLEKENKFLRERRELQLELEKERASWKKKEQAFTNKIRQLDNKSVQSSVSSASPSQQEDEEIKDFMNPQALIGARGRSSTSSTADPSRYNNFQRTVDDALKQIEKISSDLKHIDAPRRGSDTLSVQGDRASSTPSPRLQPPNTTQLKPQTENTPSPNAPWRTRRRSSLSKHGITEHTLSPDDKTNVSSPSIKGDSPIDVALSLPAINTAQILMKRSPNPERKVRKINKQGSQVDITVSSPDAPNQKTDSSQRRYFPFEDQSISESSSPHDFIDLTPKEYKQASDEKREPIKSKERKISQGKPSGVSRQRPVDFSEPTQSIQSLTEKAQLPKDTQVKNRGGVPGANLSVKEDESATGRSSSPRLPKLHQQLLFKKEPVPPSDRLRGQRSIESESLASTDKGKTSDDEVRILTTYKEKVSLALPKGRDSLKTHTPYFDPDVGYVRGSRSPSKDLDKVPGIMGETDSLKGNISVSSQKNASQVNHASIIVAPPSGDKKREDAFSPPVVHPKPKVAIHKDPDGNIVRVFPTVDRKSASPESLQGSEKQYSIAGRMGRAGRDWIRKKLSFKERRPEEQGSTERSPSTPDHPKKKGKSKVRQRSSSLLRNKANNRRSVTTTEESSDAEQEGRKRESFLRRSKRRSRQTGGSGDSKNASPAKSKPKKYTRSKTEASPKDMKNFLTKFKASQNNPNKPSIVKQFERKLLENEVKTLEENVGKAYPREEQNLKDVAHPKTETSIQQRHHEDGYLSGDEGDVELDRISPKEPDRRSFLPSIPKNKESTGIQNKVALRQKASLGPPVKPKTYYRKSMTDFKPQPVLTEPSSVTEPRLRGKEDDGKCNATREAGELCRGKGVSKLVNRFSANLDDEGVTGVKKPLQDRPKRRSSLIKPVEPGKRSPDSHSISRSHSMSSQDGHTRSKRFTTSVRFDTGSIKERTSSNTPNEAENPVSPTGSSWRDRVIAKPESDASETGSQIGSLIPSSGYGVKRSQKTSARPGQYDSLPGFWFSERPSAPSGQGNNNSTSSKTGRMKIMSEEMKRKTDMLEKALSKGPRKPRRYRRADTQPVHTTLNSSDDDSLSDSDENMDVAFRPYLRDRRTSKEVNGTKAVDLGDGFQVSGKMHEIIPPVAGKFSKPAKPGRLPSRWAR